MRTGELNQKPLGQILIEAGLISLPRIDVALREQQQNGLRIGEILVARGWIEPKTVDFFGDRWHNLLAAKEKKTLSYYLQEAGLLDTEQVNTIRQLQELKHTKVRFHHLAVEAGYLKQITVDFFLLYLFQINPPNDSSVFNLYKLLESHAQGQQDFAQIDLRNAPMMGISLNDVRLDGANLRKADLSQANLTGTSLIGANLKRVNFTEANLTSANLSKSRLIRAIFQQARLEKANFQAAMLHEVDFEAAYLAKANFAGADLRGAKLPAHYSYAVYYDRETVFDLDFDPTFAGWKII